MLNKLFGRSDDNAGNTEPSPEIKNILHNLELMAQAEEAVARFYAHCAELMSDDHDFWLSMSKSEMHHKANIKRMIKLIEENPSQFKPGIKFNPATIRVFCLYLERLPDRSKAENMSRDEILRIAEDLENSAVELDYGKLVTTRNEEFNRLVGEIDNETTDHRDAISRKRSS